MTKPKTPRFYIPAHVRETVNAAAFDCGMSPGEIVEGAVAHLMNDLARTGQHPGAALARMIEDANRKAARRAELAEASRVAVGDQPGG